MMRITILGTALIGACLATVCHADSNGVPTTATINKDMAAEVPAGTAQDSNASARLTGAVLDPDQQHLLEAFQNMRFGLFIHWGLYAVPAGEWKGQQVRGLGEHIMRWEEIPVAEYEQLAKGFNPVEFNADEWVQLAADAGMKYLVITAKHHDGFAMYDSRASRFDIVDATPYGRDPMKALAEACKKRDIAFGFYYSQAQDWHDPNAAGNTWDFPTERDPAPYIGKKLLPQVEELLTGYGDLALIWFDTPRLLNRDQVVNLRSRVKELQPGCLVNSRIGHNQGDYDQTGDNSIPTQVYTNHTWEVPATLNDTWGFKKNDHDWKDPRDLIGKLADIASKGGNYLLNIGPDARGVVPEESQKILRQIGEWMAVNSASIYGTRHSPFNINGITWRCTTKPNTLYLHMLSWPGSNFTLEGLLSEVTEVQFLDGGQAIPFKQIDGALSLALPEKAPDSCNTVIAVRIADEQARVARPFRYDVDPEVRHLYAWEARMRGEEFVYDWESASASHFIDGTRPRNELRWINHPKKEGTYRVEIEYACDNDKAGSPFYLSSRRDEWVESEANSDLLGTIEGTDGEFRRFELGEMKLFSPDCAILFGLKDDFRSASVRVRKLILTPVDQ